ncbi:MAG TPA: HAD hydrolase-like protein [Candidatus Angelobacter sp.]
MRRFVKAVAFDFGHTLVHEQTVDDCIQLMPGVGDILPRIILPMAVWANTRTAAEAVLWDRLKAAQIEQYFSCVATSIDAGFRKPAPEFFQFALSKWPFAEDEILFVCNQLNTDVLGGESFGIRTAWLSAPEFRGDDETMSLDDVKPTFTLSRFADLPSLLEQISI